MDRVHYDLLDQVDVDISRDCHSHPEANEKHIPVFLSFEQGELYHCVCDMGKNYHEPGPEAFSS